MSNQSSSPQGSSHQEDQDNQELSRQRGGAAGTPSSEADRTQFLSLRSRRAALHWAMTDQPPPSSPLIALQSPTACAELRQCIQHCYALSLSRRYNKAKGAASQPRSNK